MTNEEKIFEAARKVFQKKGFAAARMQEIADEAEINKAMLHYFFRSREQLFKAVFMTAFGQLVPQMNAIFNSEESVFVKIEKFTANYIDFVNKNRFLPAFIIQEMNNNPEFVTEILASDNKPKPDYFIKQIEEEIEKGILKPIPPKQLLLDIFSMTVFPFVGQVLVKGILNISDEEFNTLIDERKKHIAQQIINAIKK